MGAGSRTIDKEGTLLAANLTALRIQKLKATFGSATYLNGDIEAAENMLAKHIQDNAKKYSKLAIEQILESQQNARLGEAYLKLLQTMKQKPPAKV